MSRAGLAADAPRFHHSDVGTPAAHWTAPVRTVPGVDLPAHCDRLVVVVAHPDDETLACGGLIRLAHRRGWQVDVVVATDGEASHPRSTTHTPARLAELRRAEVVAAVDVLAPGAAVHHLGLPDSGLSSRESDLISAVVRVVGDGGAATLLVSTWLHDGHADHAAAARVCAVAAWRTDATAWQAPIWAWFWQRPGRLDLAAMVALDLDEDARAAKTAACAEHRSQVAPLSDLPGDEVLLHPGFLAHFAGSREVFVPVEPDSGTPFDDLHTGVDDPWQVRTSWYEERKRAVTLACLPRPRFASGVEVGCSIGRLSVALADRCDRLLGLDESAVAVARAGETLTQSTRSDGTGPRGAVRFERADVPQDWPVATDLDLVVLSEAGYFFSPGRLRGLAERCRQSLGPGGVVLACHWRHEIVGWPMDGAAVHALLDAELGWPRVTRHEDPDFIIDVWQVPS